jgi:hypothetical protein
MTYTPKLFTRTGGVGRSVLEALERVGLCGSEASWLPPFRAAASSAMRQRVAPTTVEVTTTMVRE